MNSLSGGDKLDKHVLELMLNRKMYFSDLSVSEQYQFLNDYQKEVEAGDAGFAGEYHQAFLGSVHGLIVTGVKRVRVYQPNGTYGLQYEHGDALHDVYLVFKPEKCIRKLAELALTNPDKPIDNRWIVGTSWATATRYCDTNGGRAVRIPSGICRVRIGHRMNDARDISWSERLTHNDYEEAVKYSGTGKALLTNTQDLGRAIERFEVSLPVVVEDITDELTWEHRLLVDSDMSDDEIMGDSNEPADSSDQLYWDDALDVLESIEQYKALPWHILDEREKDIIHRRFGLGEYKDDIHTLQKIGDEYNLTRERIRQIEERALQLLLEPIVEPKKRKSYKLASDIPEERLSEFGKCMRDVLIRWDVPLKSCADFLGVTITQVEGWMTGKGVPEKFRGPLFDFLDLPYDSALALIKDHKREADFDCSEYKNLNNSLTTAVEHKAMSGFESLYVRLQNSKLPLNLAETELLAKLMEVDK